MNHAIDDIMETIGLGKFQWLLLFICGLSFISDAMEIVLMTFIIKPLQTEFHCSDFTISLLASGVFFGMLCGSVLMGPLSDSIGRKKSFLLCMTMVNLGGFCSIASAASWIFLICRMIVGAGVGGLHLSVTILAEFLPLQSRTLMITFLQGFWSIGVVLEVALSWLLRYSSWRTLVFCSAIPALIATIAAVWIPESPLYLISKKKYTEAGKVFSRVAQMNSSGCEIEEILPTQSEASSQHTTTLKERLHMLFSIDIYRQTLFSLMFLWFVGSFNYCGSLFMSADINFGDYSTIFLISLGEILSKCASFVLLFRWSRKSNIALCLGLCVACVLVIMVKNFVPKWMVISSMLLFRVAISMYLTALSLYTPECFPTEIRSSGFGIATSGSRIGGMLTPFIAIMVKSMSFSICMGFFLVTLLLAEISVYFLPLETKTMSLSRKAGEEKIIP